MHTPSPGGPDITRYRVRHNIVTIYDLTTTILRPWAQSQENIEIADRLLEFTKRHCSGVLAISEYTKGDIVEHLGIPADRIDVTPLAPRVSTRPVTDPAELGRALAELGLTGHPYVLYSGTLEPRKNLKRLVCAFAQAVAEARLPDHRLVLAGGAWGRHDLEVRAHAEDLGIGDRLVTTGYVSNAAMNALMSACAAFAYVSEHEGDGLPPLEAMTCGAPVVTSDTTSLPEVVGGAGIQVSPTNTEEIAAALYRLLTDDGENARRRQKSLERARPFSWERTAVLTLQSYEAAVC